MESNKETNTEQKIIDVAKELFATNGYEGTSIREICKSADVNISLISYYFGGKKELYQKIIESITKNIALHMQSEFGLLSGSIDFESMDKSAKIDLFFKMINHLINYFYSDRISDASIMLIFREQITSGVPLDAPGYRIFKRLLASILGKDENNKEVIFRCLSIVGQVNSARVLKQFSLKMMNQDSYSKEDIDLFKNIVLDQTKSILTGLGVYDA